MVPFIGTFLFVWALVLGNFGAAAAVFLLVFAIMMMMEV